MKRIVFFVILCLVPTMLYAANDGRTPQGVGARERMVLGRGALNVIGTPLEIFATPIREHNIHSKAWPLTGIIRIPTNVFARLASAANDLFVYPWVVSFTNDISPITDSMDLPKYAWSRE